MALSLGRTARRERGRGECHVELLGGAAWKGGNLGSGASPAGVLQRIVVVDGVEPYPCHSRNSLESPVVPTWSLNCNFRVCSEFTHAVSLLLWGRPCVPLYSRGHSGARAGEHACGAHQDQTHPPEPSWSPSSRRPAGLSRRWVLASSALERQRGG